MYGSISESSPRRRRREEVVASRENLAWPISGVRATSPSPFVLIDDFRPSRSSGARRIGFKVRGPWKSSCHDDIGSRALLCRGTSRPKPGAYIRQQKRCDVGECTRGHFGEMGNDIARRFYDYLLGIPYIFPCENRIYVHIYRFSDERRNL